KAVDPTVWPTWSRDCIQRLSSHRRPGKCIEAIQRGNCGREYIQSFRKGSQDCLARSPPGVRLKPYACPASMHFSTARQRFKSIICAQHSRCGDTAKIRLLGFSEPRPAT